MPFLTPTLQPSPPGPYNPNPNGSVKKPFTSISIQRLPSMPQQDYDRQIPVFNKTSGDLITCEKYNKFYFDKSVNSGIIIIGSSKK